MGVVLLAVATSGANAGDCGPVRVSASPEAARLQRQIAANRAFEVKYSCSAQSTFACREIAGRIAQASAKLASLSGASRQVCQKPVVAERTRTRTPKATADQAQKDEKQMQARIETRCVRLSDGYSFPTPNSGYNTAKDMDRLVAQCKFICEDPGMDLYRMTDTDRDTEDMISLTTGARYTELPNAGAYRTSASFKSCDMSRFYKTVLATTPAADAADENRTRARTEVAEGRTDTSVALLGDVGLRGTSTFLPEPARKVRVVGAAYLPEN